MMHRRATTFLVLLVLTVAAIAAATTMDTLQLRSNAFTFATLGTPTPGAQRYCSDCAGANPCAGSGSGAMARGEGTAWNCGSASQPTPTPPPTPVPTATAVPTATPIPTTFAKWWIDAGGCQGTTAAALLDLPSSNPAVAACVTGTNTQKGVLDFADGANALSAQVLLKLPTADANGRGGYDSSGATSVNIKWFSSTTSGDVVWQVATACVADGSTDDPSFNAASTVTDTTKGTANQLNDAAISTLTMTGCSAGNVLHVKILRDPAHASDTMAGTARLVGIEIVLPRT